MRVLTFLWRTGSERLEEIHSVGSSVVWIDELTKDIKLKIGRRTIQALVALLRLVLMSRKFADCDVVYVPSDFWTQVIASILTKLTKKPLVIRLREDPFETRRHILPTKTRLFVNAICLIFNKIDEAVYKRADLIISISYNLAQRLKRFSQNVVTVWNGIDEKFLEHEPKPKKAPKKILFGYVGRVSKEKGIDSMLEAVRGLPVKLLVFGAMKYAVVFPENVKYSGELPHEKIEEAYSKFDVLVLPSFTEGLPRALQEAMLLGKGVICTDTGDNRMIIDKDGGWVCQPTVKDIRRAFLEAEKLEKRLLLKMGLYNRKKAVRIFYSWEEYAEKVKRHILQCLKRVELAHSAVS